MAHQALEYEVIQSEFGRILLVHVAPVGVQPADLLAPEYWVHVAPGLRQRTQVEVFSTDNTWYARLLVLGRTQAGVRMVPISFVDLVDADAHGIAQTKAVFPPLERTIPPTSPDAYAAYRVEFGGAHRWRVVRTSDNTVVFRDGVTRQDAEDALAGITAERMVA